MTMQNGALYYYGKQQEYTCCLLKYGYGMLCFCSLTFDYFLLQNLKDIMADLIPKHQKTVKEFKAKYDNTVVGEVTVAMVSIK